MSHTRLIVSGLCAYCGTARAVHRDHIVSSADRRRYGIAKNDVRYHAGACVTCNLNKLTRRLVPPTHAYLVDELNELTTGTRWRVWNGDAAGLAVGR